MTPHFQLCCQFNSMINKLIFHYNNFRWMKDIFRLGLKGPISPDEIYKPKATLESKRITDAFIEKWSEELKRENPSVLRVILKIYGVPLIFWGLTFCLMESAMRLDKYNFFAFANGQRLISIFFRYSQSGPAAMSRWFSLIFCTESNTHIEKWCLLVCRWYRSFVGSNCDHFPSIYFIHFRNGSENSTWLCGLGVS